MEILKETFTKSWWKKFTEINKNFTQACVLKDAIDSCLLERLNKGIIEVLIERFKLKDIKKGFRVYLDGVEQDDKVFLKNLCDNPPSKDENIVEYSKRMFETKFGIIINGGEKHSDTIADNLINVMQPLMEIIGTPAAGLEITIFIGDYGWTPLGIHQDQVGENVIHFHLGPGKKTMYVWDEKEYEELTGRKFNNMDIEPILKFAHEFPFETGDIYYMPWNKFHVGYSDELSVGLTLWFNNPTKYSYLKRVMDSFLFQNSEEEKNKDILIPRLDYLDNPDTIEDFMSTIKLDEDALSVSTLDFFKGIHEEFKYSLMSNGGWQSVPLSLELKEKYIVDNYEHLLDKNIHSKEPFKIYFKKNKDTLIIYVRGSKIEMRYHEELISIINNLNSHNVFLVRDLLENLSIEWPIEAGLYFLSLLYDKRGFQIL